MDKVCPSCKQAVNETYFFCPNCGKKLKEPPFKFSWGKAIGIILTSILLPPFGLIPGIKYVLKDDSKAQIVGVLALILTFIVTGAVIIYSINLYKQFAQTYQQLNQTQNLLNTNLGQ